MTVVLFSLGILFFGLALYYRVQWASEKAGREKAEVLMEQWRALADECLREFRGSNERWVEIADGLGKQMTTVIAYGSNKGAKA